MPAHLPNNTYEYARYASYYEPGKQLERILVIPSVLIFKTCTSGDLVSEGSKSTFPYPYSRRESYMSAIRRRLSMPPLSRLPALWTSRLSASEEPGHARCMEGRLDASGDMRYCILNSADIVADVGRRRGLPRSVAVLGDLLRRRPGLFDCERRPDEEDRVPVSGISV